MFIADACRCAQHKGQLGWASMRVLIVLAHPSPASFNHAIAREVANSLTSVGHQVILKDLYAEDFDPLLASGEAARTATLPAPVTQAVAELAEADGVVIVHPNWWGMPPAILTGWVDRVVRVDSAYKFQPGDHGEGVPVGLLKARAALVINTADTDPARERDVFGDPLERIWRDCIFGLCGVHDFHRKTFSVTVTSTDTERASWLSQASELARTVFPSEKPSARTGRRIDADPRRCAQR